MLLSMDLHFRVLGYQMDSTYIPSLSGISDDWEEKHADKTGLEITPDNRPH